MTAREQRHIMRLIMRVTYTVTGFFTAILAAAVAHDGLAPAGGILPQHQLFLGAAAVSWAISVVLDGWTSQPAFRTEKDK